MQTSIKTISYASSIHELEQLLGDHRISGVPVSDEAGRIIGVVTQRDLVQLYSQESDPHGKASAGYYHPMSVDEVESFSEDLHSLNVPDDAQETVEAIMNAEVYSVGPDADLRDIAGEMTRRTIHRVLVIDAGHCIGIVSTTEILAALAGM